MSNERYKTTADEFVRQVINTGDMNRASEYFADDYIEHDPPPGYPVGLTGLKQFFTDFHTAFPDLHFTVDDTIAEGDKVVARVTGHGTMKGPFMGMPPSGKSAEWTEIHVTRVGPNGKYVEHWANVDQANMLMQLGFMPSPNA